MLNNLADEAYSASGPLSGVRVIDLTRNLAGPFCTMLLADMGANVIKLEQPGTGDELRNLFRYPGRSLDNEDYFAAFNRNKEGLAVDLKTEQGREILSQLISKSDIMVENLSPGAVERLGFSPARVAQLNDQIIYCSISGFGKTGNVPNLPAYDGVVQAASGVMASTGYREAPPVRCGPPIGDLAAALFAATSILAAFAARARRGKGEYIDIAMFDSLLALQGNLAAEYFATGRSSPRNGNQVSHRLPQGTFRTRDDEHIFLTTNNKSWPRLCAALSLPDRFQSEKYATNQSRLGHRDEINGAIESAFASLDAHEVLTLLQSAAVPCSQVSSLDDALESELSRERSMIVPLTRDDGSSTRVVGNPCKFASVPQPRYEPAPRLGEHSASILKSLLGFDDTMIGQMAQNGIIGCR